MEVQLSLFFSKLKYNTSANLSGVNYASARAAILTRGSVQGNKRNVGLQRCSHVLTHAQAAEVEVQKFISDVITLLSSERFV